MRRVLPVVLALAAAVCAATARADTFAVVTPRSTVGVPLPSAAIPNLPGSVAFPVDLSAPPAAPAVLARPQLLALWQSAGAAYGIPWQVLAAINQVESDFGRNMGPSSAGAVGWMQFMPSTWARWGVDANGDGIADPWNPDDAVYAAARYLAAAGGASDLRRAVFAYNHAGWYVDEVLGLAQLAGRDGGGVFMLDTLQTRLDAARSEVSDASGRLLAAQERARTLAGLTARRQRRADAAGLLSTRLELERSVGLARARLRATQAQVRRARTALRTAQAGLVRARRAATPVSFSASASPLLGAPSYASGWVFPVGGGPQLVSVAHTHHDYPAADIAAPAGSPVYALAAGVVVRSWTEPDPRCGIGFVFRSGDGQEWTYCHLAWLEPSVVAGATLAAGAPVGLVGSTGDATGPHLHLQLDPQTAYPQDEPWFAAFAGVAFSWQDAAPVAPQQPGLRFLSVVRTEPAPAPHVFAVVPSSSDVVLFSRP
ncbi:MAG TPA: lytic murein transglycosylase [Gaiellaceae bacterium]|nr:lytic murein transglycosylase [Gaiellaceae bacterium]